MGSQATFSGGGTTSVSDTFEFYSYDGAYVSSAGFLCSAGDMLANATFKTVAGRIGVALLEFDVAIDAAVNPALLSAGVMNCEVRTEAVDGNNSTSVVVGIDPCLLTYCQAYGRVAGCSKVHYSNIILKDVPDIEVGIRVSFPTDGFTALTVRGELLMKWRYVPQCA